MTYTATIKVQEIKDLKIVNCPVGSLQPNNWNTNTVSPANEAKIEEGIKRFGFFKPVIARTLPNGKLEIIGGEHRWGAAKRMGMKEVPVLNLGPITDKQAKEISLVDNGRYGADDTLALAELLEGLGTADDLTKFMPYTDADLASIFASTNIALDDLDLPDDADIPPSSPVAKVQSHQVMRFKIPVGDADMVTETLVKIMKLQRFDSSDSLTNAGDALVHLCKESK